MKPLSLFLLILSILSSSTGSLYAQSETKAAKVRIYHRINSKLPPPGSDYDIEMKLSGSHKTDEKIQLMLVSDGQLSTIPLKGRLNDIDEAIYKASIIAPRAQIYYKFAWYKADGSVVISDRFELTRDCLPNIKTVEINHQEDLSLDDSDALKQIQSKNQSLENELNLINKAASLVEELKKLPQLSAEGK